MDEKSLKGKIVSMYVKESGNHKIPIFKVKLDSGKIVETGRGDVSVETFPKFMKMTADEMAKFSKQQFYGLKVGQTIYISQQYNWD